MAYILSFRNSLPLITQTLLLRTTKVYGQILGRGLYRPNMSACVKSLTALCPAPTLQEITSLTCRTLLDFYCTKSLTQDTKWEQYSTYDDCCGRWLYCISKSAISTHGVLSCFSSMPSEVQDTEARLLFVVTKFAAGFS
jgi:hypothetical protein